MSTEGFSFGKHRGAAGKELKQQLADSGETFDIVGVEQDLSTDGTLLWRVYIRYGDVQKGMLFFGQDDSGRSTALAELAESFANGDTAAQPAVVKQVRTIKGRDYYFLDDPAV